MRRVPFQEFHQPVNPELWVTPDEQVNVVRQDLQLNEFLPPALNLLGQNNLEPFIYGGINTLRRYFGQNTT